MYNESYKQKGGNAMRLLLAEDEQDLSKALCAILKHNNYSVDAVYDLTGRRVTNPSKGIYVVNGKLKLVK